ncbi:MAG TPA: hypothetical protein VFK10_05230, partial [Burkholderiaceae bacterium]|nr:hypothetical protein [Burkholderiaceae bacterium]
SSAWRASSLTLFKVAQAVRQLQAITAAMAPEQGEVNAAGVPMTGYTRVDVFANVEDRRLAEFTEDEIAEILRQEGFSGLVNEATEARRA